jgi:hypothetical protein
LSLSAEKSSKRFGAKADCTADGGCFELTFVNQSANVAVADMQQLGRLGHGHHTAWKPLGQRGFRPSFIPLRRRPQHRETGRSFTQEAEFCIEAWLAFEEVFGGQRMAALLRLMAAAVTVLEAEIGRSSMICARLILRAIRPSAAPIRELSPHVRAVALPTGRTPVR